MFLSIIPTKLRIVVLFSLIIIPIYSLTLPSRSHFPLHDDSPQHFTRRQHGNSNAASDLYGLGLRVGAYLQVFGMLLSCLRSDNRSRVGIKLLSSSVCVSLLISWTILVSGQNISPCEAWLVLSLTNAYGTPRSAAINDSHKKNGGVAILVSAIAVIWQAILFIWFFATLYRSLPLLGTYNRVWFFTAVDITGWFRILMLVYCCLKFLLLPFEFVAYFSMGVMRFNEWSEGKEDNDVKGGERSQRNGNPPSCQHTTSHDQQFSISSAKMWGTTMRHISTLLGWVDSNPVFLKMRFWIVRLGQKLAGTDEDTNETTRHKLLGTFRKYSRLLFCGWGFIILTLTIAGVEKIIEYNNLSPQNDLSQPGQAIPFILGIITFIEGASKACRPIPLPQASSGHDETASDSAARPSDEVEDDTEWRTVPLGPFLYDTNGSSSEGNKEQ
jgi:hypothetical protein